MWYFYWISKLFQQCGNLCFLIYYKKLLFYFNIIGPRGDKGPDGNPGKKNITVLLCSI
jgi:hypothetical protein